MSITPAVFQTHSHHTLVKAATCRTKANRLYLSIRS